MPYKYSRLRVGGLLLVVRELLQAVLVARDTLGNM